MDWLIMAIGTASTLETATAQSNHRLLPRRIDIGPLAGHYVLPVRVIDDPGFDFLHGILAGLDRIAADASELWEPEGD